MVAVILAAGRGSRIGKLSNKTPKSMLSLSENHTLLSYNFMQLSKCQIKKVILVSGYEAKKLETYAIELAKKYSISLELVYNPFWNNCNVLGSLYLSLEKIKDDFIFLHADTLSDIEVIQGIIDSPNDICLAVDFKKCGEEEMKFWINNNKISRITKDDIGTEPQGEFVGVAKFRQNLVNFFYERSKEIFQSGVFDSYMEEVLDNGIISDNIEVHYFDASLYRTIEIDFLEDLEEARSIFSES